MADLRAEPGERRFPLGLLAAVLLLWILGMVLFAVFMPKIAERRAATVTPGTQGTGPEPRTQRPERPEPEDMTLNEVLRETGLPREFAYGGTNWRASTFREYEDREEDRFVAIGPTINGKRLYYEKGTPTNPYQSLYLKGEDDDYDDTFVRYRPVGPTEPEKPPKRSGTSARPQPTTPSTDGMDLDQVLMDTGLPDQFTYDGSTWTASDYGEYATTQKISMRPLGTSVEGRRLYVDEEASQPYSSVYMKSDTTGYENTFVKYQRAGSQ